MNRISPAKTGSPEQRDPAWGMLLENPEGKERESGNSLRLDEEGDDKGYPAGDRATSSDEVEAQQMKKASRLSTWPHTAPVNHVTGRRR